MPIVQYDRKHLPGGVPSWCRCVGAYLHTDGIILLCVTNITSNIQLNNALFFVCCYASTQLALQLRQERTQVVCSKKEARKRLDRRHSCNGPWTHDLLPTKPNKTIRTRVVKVPSPTRYHALCLPYGRRYHTIRFLAGILMVPWGKVPWVKVPQDFYGTLTISKSQSLTSVSIKDCTLRVPNETTTLFLLREIIKAIFILYTQSGQVPKLDFDFNEWRKKAKMVQLHHQWSSKWVMCNSRSFWHQLSWKTINPRQQFLFIWMRTSRAGTFIIKYCRVWKKRAKMAKM